MKLAILIPTIVGREDYLKRLLITLRYQTKVWDDHNDIIYTDFGCVLINKDDRVKSIGQKRNELTKRAFDLGCKYRAFIDDDDNVTDDYIELNMEGINKGVDCNRLVGIYSVNGVVNPQKYIFIHSLEYTHWFEDESYYYRNPNHLNVIKTELIKDILFPEQNFGEDGVWSEKLFASKVLKTEHFIEKPFYRYLFRNKQNGI